ncbi:MAG: hypothetical protein NT070_10935 [Cyanobacteria bacterium]|nr:hypothetical protein [Cyanobacteriota bacterium]
MIIESIVPHNRNTIDRAISIVEEVRSFLYCWDDRSAMAIFTNIHGMMIHDRGHIALSQLS